MPYGILKVDTITFTAGGVDTSVSISGLVQNPTFTGNITSTGTISGNIIQGGTTVSGATVTGTAGQFGTLTGNTAGFTTVTGTTITGTTANLVTVSGTTVTGGTARFTTLTGISGVFTTAISGATVTGNTGQFTVVTGGTAGFTTVTGTTVTGTTANFTTLSGTTATITSGVFASGTAAAPSVSVGTTTNGLFSSGANEVAISTGGSGRLFVDSTGRVGIGTSSISTISERVLHIYAGAGASSGLRLTGNAGTGLDLIHGTDGSGYLYQRDNAFLAIGTNNQERLRVTAGGLVGVGTSSPGVPLEVSATTPIVRVSLSSDATKFGNFYHSAGTTAISSRNGASNGSIAFQRFDGTTTSTSVTIDPSGNVGIGSSASSAVTGVKLLVSDSAAAYTQFNKGTSGGCLVGTEGNNTVFYTYTGAVGSESTSLRMTLNSTGLGIGTTSPGMLLTINNTTTAQLQFGYSDSIYGRIGRDSSGNYEFSSYENGSNLKFGTTGTTGSTTERARIDSSGRLLVGTSSTSSISNTVLQGRSNSSTGGALLTIARGSNNPANNEELGLIYFADSGHTGAAIIEARRDGGTWTSGTSQPTRLAFSVTRDGQSSPTERLRIANNGATTITGSSGSTSALKVDNNTNVNNDQALVTFLGSNCNNTTSYHYIAVTGGADKYYIYGNGTTGTPSDINLKKNIETTRDGYLEDLCQLRVVKYNWNEQADGEPKELGVIAQELEQVFPGLIQQGPEREDGSSYKAVKSSVLPFMLLKALQEAAAKIETLEARLSALESA